MKDAGGGEGSARPTCPNAAASKLRRLWLLRVGRGAIPGLDAAVTRPAALERVLVPESRDGDGDGVAWITREGGVGVAAVAGMGTTASPVTVLRAIPVCVAAAGRTTRKGVDPDGVGRVAVFAGDRKSVRAAFDRRGRLRGDSLMAFALTPPASSAVETPTDADSDDSPIARFDRRTPEPGVDADARPALLRVTRVDERGVAADDAEAGIARGLGLGLAGVSWMVKSPQTLALPGGARAHRLGVRRGVRAGERSVERRGGRGARAACEVV